MTQNSKSNSSSSRVGMDKKKKLGRGLGALLGEVKREELLQSAKIDNKKNGFETDGYTPEGLNSLPLSSIDPLPGQPRKQFDQDALEELAASIAARGVIQPIIVRQRPGGRFQIVAGERRWRAAQKARLHEIPALVRELDDRDVMALALIENIQRQDLNVVEEALAYRHLGDKEGLSQAEIAQMVEKSRSHVANLQRLLSLPEGVLDLIQSGELSMGHARALIGHDDALGVAQRVIEEGLSVRNVEALVRTGEGAYTPNPPVREAQTAAKSADVLALERRLGDVLGLSVEINVGSNAQRGEIAIKYQTLDQLDMVCDRLSAGHF